MGEEIASVKGRVLEHDYRHIDEAIPETVMVTPGGDRFHLPAPTSVEQPMCTAKDYHGDFLEVPQRKAMSSGFYACSSCFRPILVFLSISPDSPVERSEGFRDLGNSDVSDTELLEMSHSKSDQGDGFTEANLNSLTQEVLASSNTMHAPTEDGPLCGSTGSFRRVEPEKVKGFREPCGMCFDIENDESEGVGDVWRKSEA